MHNRVMRAFGLLFIILINVPNLEATDFNYRNYRLDDGLPSSQIYNVVQDENGYLWFSSNNGISRYDGVEFVNYDVNQGLPENIVFHLFPQENKEIWGTTLSGQLFYFNTADYKIKKYKYNTVIKKFIKRQIVNSLYIDHKSIYIGFNGFSGYIKVDSNGILHDYTDNIHSDILWLINAIKSGNTPNSSLTFAIKRKRSSKRTLTGFDTKSCLATSNYYQRSIRRGSKTVFISKNFIEFQDLEKNWRKELASLPFSTGFYKNQIWVGLQNQGVSFYSSEGRFLNSILPGKSVSDLLIDHAGGMWVTTLNSGVYYVQNPSIQRMDILNKDGNDLRNLVSVPNDGIYIGFNNGQVLRYNSGSVSLHTGPSPEGTFSIIQYNKHFDKLIQVLPEHSNNLYKLYSGDDLIYPKVRGSSRKFNGISRITDDNSKKEILVVGFPGLFRFDENFNMKFYKTELRIIDAVRAPDGYYLATRKGLYHLSESNKITPLSSRDSLFSYAVFHINSSRNYYYMSIQGKGLVVFNSDTIFRIQKSDGLVSNKINNLYTQNDSVIWVSTISGLSRLCFLKDGGYKIDNISKIDGLDYSLTVDVVVENDTVWVATGKGLNAFPTSIMDRTKESNLFLRVSNLKVNNSSMVLNALSNLDHEQNNLKIKVQAISYNHKLIKYRYRLVGLEDEWNHTTSRDINYMSLPPGEYSLVVQATQTNFNSYKEEQTLSIIISPPFYSLWWFRLLLVLALVYVLYLFFKLRILNYNKDIIRELLRQFLKRVKRKQKFIVIREQGKTVRINTSKINYIKSSNNNIEIHTSSIVHYTRAKISEIMSEIPDQLEFLRIHRSYIIRLDKVEQFDRKRVIIGGNEIPISAKYHLEYIKVLF